MDAATAAAQTPVEAPSRTPLGQVLTAAGAIGDRDLAEALDRQRFTGARLGEVLRANGVISAGALARALGEQQRGSYADLAAEPPDPELMQGADLGLLLAAGAAPWRREAGRVVYASADPEAARAAFARAGHGDVAVAAAEPGAVRAALEAGGADGLAARAASRTPRRLSARPLARLGPRLALAVLWTVAVSLAVAMPAAALATLAALAVATSLINVGLRFAMMLAPQGDPEAKAARAAPVGGLRAPPTISLIVPLYREPEMVAGLIAALERLDYPRERVEAFLALEADDAKTRAAVDGAGAPPWIGLTVTPPGGPRTKPRALNHALGFCRGEIVGVYDAEDRPAPDQLIKVAESFRVAPSRVACAQARLGFYNADENWMSRCFAIEYATWFHVMIGGLARFGFPVPLGGTSVFLRRRALEGVGGWDAHNVTEDADLGVRLARAGFRTALVDSTTWEEANCRPGAWVRQRSRWQKGYLTTWLSHMRAPFRLWRELGARGFLGFQLVFLGAAAAFFSQPVLWGLWLWWAAVGAPWMTLGAPPQAVLAVFGALLAGQAVMLASALLALARAGELRRWPWALTLPFYWPLGALSAVKAMVEIVTAPVYWDKTRHGVSRWSAPPTLSAASRGGGAT